MFDLQLEIYTLLTSQAVRQGGIVVLCNLGRSSLLKCMAVECSMEVLYCSGFFVH